MGYRLLAVAASRPRPTVVEVRALAAREDFVADFSVEVKLRWPRVGAGESGDATVVLQKKRGNNSSD